MLPPGVERSRRLFTIQQRHPRCERRTCRVCPTQDGDSLQSSCSAHQDIHTTHPTKCQSHLDTSLTPRALLKLEQRNVWRQRQPICSNTCPMRPTAHTLRWCRSAVQTFVTDSSPSVLLRFAVAKNRLRSLFRHHVLKMRVPAHTLGQRNVAAAKLRSEFFRP